VNHHAALPHFSHATAITIDPQLEAGGPPADHRGTKNKSKDGLPSQQPEGTQQSVSRPSFITDISFKSLDRNCSPILMNAKEHHHQLLQHQRNTAATIFKATLLHPQTTGVSNFDDPSIGV